MASDTSTQRKEGMDKKAITLPIRIHTGFETQGAAYDCTQTDETIRDGDIVVTTLGTAAILMSAWPTVIGTQCESPQYRAFHELNPDMGITWNTVDEGRYLASKLAYVAWFSERYDQPTPDNQVFEIWTEERRDHYVNTAQGE
jgi:hypothetical protein